MDRNGWKVDRCGLARNVSLEMPTHLAQIKTSSQHNLKVVVDRFRPSESNTQKPLKFSRDIRNLENLVKLLITCVRKGPAAKINITSEVCRSPD